MPLLKVVEHSEDTCDSADCNVNALLVKRLPKEHEHRCCSLNVWYSLKTLVIPQNAV